MNPTNNGDTQLIRKYLPMSPIAPTIPKIPTIAKSPTAPIIPTIPMTPTVPKIPTIPTIPIIPTSPKIPTIPTIPIVPKSPTVPTIPMITIVPKSPTIPILPNPSTIPKSPIIIVVPNPLTIPKNPNVGPTSVIIMQNEVQRLYDFLLPLRDNRFYSYEIKHTSKETNIPIDRLVKYVHGSNTPESLYFEKQTKDHVNIFTYNDVTYIGLETERVRYDRDKQNKTNYVENLIHKGYYGQ